MPAQITSHAEERGRERMGLTKSALARTAEIALRDGFKHADASGPLRRYLDRIFLSHRTANNLRIYGEQLYIFNGSTLITVHPVPNSLRRNLKKMRAHQNEPEGA